MLILGLLIDVLITTWLFSGPVELEPPPDDFPKLEASIHMDQGELAAQWCPGVFMLRGCAVVNFNDMTCKVLIVGNSEANLKEELSHRHCEGFDHRGENTIRGAWQNFKNGSAE